MRDEQIFKHASTNPLPGSCPPGLYCHAIRYSLDLFVHLIICKNAGWVSGWLQRGHNGLPQRAGFSPEQVKLFLQLIWVLRQFGASHRAKNSSTFISEPRITSNLIIKKNVSVHEESSRWLRCTTRGGRCQRTRTTLSWEDSRQRWPVLLHSYSTTLPASTTAYMRIVLPYPPMFRAQLVISIMTQICL